MSPMPALTQELFQTLLAIGWIDGELVAAERDAILDAASRVGLPAGEVDALRRMADTRVTFADMQFDHLDGPQRLFIYAVASWVAQVDDTVTSEERAALHAIATLLRVTGRGRARMDQAVAELRAAPDAPDRMDLEGLRDRVAGALTGGASA